MIWKTDWQNGDDYALDSVADVQRLLNNYSTLKAVLNDEYGFNISFDTPATNGRRTFPFADFLNTIEDCLKALHVWTVEWIDKVALWQAGERSPTFEDINRWERNGWAIEQAAERIKGAFIHCGTTYSGMGGIRV